MKLIRLDTVDSTNRYAKELALQTKESAFAVLAKHQTAGKGRVGRSFESPQDSGMYLSICHKTPIAPDEVGLITAYTAVAVREAIWELCGIDCKIKWVNDLYAGGKKVCGILAEGRIDGTSGKLAYVVVGIGVNIFPPKDGFIAAGKGIAGALGEFAALPEDIAAALPLSVIEKLKDLPQRVKDLSFLDDYRAHSLLIGKEVTVYPTTLEQGGGQSAKVLAIDDAARLVVQTSDGAVKALYSGEVSVRIADSQ